MHVHQQPCLHCNPQTYIRVVQHLIELCLLLGMTRDDCVGAIAVHANIRPTITLIVWEQLMEENRDYFRAYHHQHQPFLLLHEFKDERS
ncbi:hypothetical protein ZOSMA_52G01250 [Zostera marina]|uniref:Uncharacterized protein n=1 Tax=Zostera marina TaxID=29655 RepID=A0A0K9NXI7_ZOSMR|nr:hypothetical protein ZOSMA_52G01250 [Zostera marina]